ncbi:hypothetical protein N24_1315 [Corynebacterium suranareeae]|uniref:HlyC/CorC family transporter n=1 Tax=Corynebacterium suranareeae TaxID=2506452 RepID=A0A160PNQ3_9CORY|nr:hemolysin family protein [Corynebacterium suranareeae]BAU95577.1 hypothetical protein N24_1315 [Corynebacterium suranareeae]
MLTAILSLLAGLVIIGAIIILNGLFVAQEFAYMSVDRNELRTLADSGDKKAQRALKITNRTSFMLSGAQLGITVTGLLVGFVAEPLVGNALGVMLGGVGIPTAVSISVGTILALAISTIVQMIFGELFPKNYTIAAPLKSALALAPSTTWYLKLTGWLIKFFDLSSNALLKLLRIEPVEDVDSSATTKDLPHIVASSRDSGDLDDSTSLSLDRLLDFPTHDVGHAMIPRSRVGVVDPDTTINEVRSLMAVAHTRYPVIDENHVPVGVISLLDILGTEVSTEFSTEFSTVVSNDTPVTELMSKPVVVPEFMSLPDVVTELQDREEKLACVIDEYGGFIGIVTLEDLAEEILGDVTDEHDTESTEEITPTSVDEWLIDGDTPVDEVERAIRHDLPEGDYETISGLLFDRANSLLSAGDVVDISLELEPDDYLNSSAPTQRLLRITVLDVERNVPSKLALKLVELDQPVQEETS